jgi:Rrf2 family protein
VKVSHRGLYALKALIHLATAYEGGALVPARTVAEKEDIPEKFLEGILLALKNARVVSSERGREGGYRLRKPPGEIFIGDVMRLIDGPLAPLGDVSELQQRVRTEVRHPGLFGLFLEVRNAAAAIVDRTSLADLLERDREVLAARGARKAS